MDLRFLLSVNVSVRQAIVIFNVQRGYFTLHFLKRSDVNALIVTINDLRSLLCARAKLICKYGKPQVSNYNTTLFVQKVLQPHTILSSAQRKLGDVRADPKADPTVLETAVQLEKIANGKLIRNKSVKICSY